MFSTIFCNCASWTVASAISFDLNSDTGNVVEPMLTQNVTSFSADLAQLSSPSVLQGMQNKLKPYHAISSLGAESSVTTNSDSFLMIAISGQLSVSTVTLDKL